MKVIYITDARSEIMYNIFVPLLSIPLTTAREVVKPLLQAGGGFIILI